MKRKLTINEELNRMKGLMSYENGQHKNPIISEQDDDEEQNDDVTQLGKGRLKDNPDALYDEELYKPSSNIQKNKKG